MAAAARLIDIGTPLGPARASVEVAEAGRGLLVLGHGAGGGIEAVDLLAARDAALAAGFSVARVEQPYRVAGRRTAPPAARLDAAWEAAVEELAGERILVLGGRSSGARVACRTAAALGAHGVLCLAFPLEPPGGRPSRIAELDAVPNGVPALVVQGRSDRFGVPPPGPGREVVVLDGDHGLKRDAAGVRRAVQAWLGRLAEVG